MVPSPVPRLAGIAIALLVVASPSPAACAAQEAPIPVLPVMVSVASVNGKAVASDAWIDAQLGHAERLFGEAGIHFRKAGVRPLPPRFAALVTRADRDALAAEVTRGAINVMIVDSLQDVDDPKLRRMGVHWQPAGTPRRHYVIVAASAWETTMAHEIGHFFGNGHSKTVNNLMSYERSGDAVFLSETQKKTSRAFCRLYLRIKEIVPSAPPPPPAAPAALGLLEALPADRGLLAL